MPPLAAAKGGVQGPAAWVSSLQPQVLGRDLLVAATLGLKGLL